MKLFVAMTASAPTDTDFSHTVDGELVCIPYERCGDMNCDCAHTMVGLASGEATTTYTVSDLPHFSTDDVIMAFTDGMARAGHIDPDSDLGRETAKRYALEHIEIAALLPEGGIYWAIHPPAA